jgi:hypothetical protein
VRFWLAVSSLIHVPCRCERKAEFNGVEVSVALDRRPGALKFGDEDLHFLFRQIPQIALRQIGAALKFGIFGEKLSQKLHHLGSRLGHSRSQVVDQPRPQRTKLPETPLAYPSCTCRKTRRAGAPAAA